MNYDFDVCRLSQKFYNAYPSQNYPEILCKPERPYTCLLIEMHDDYFICIPFRSSITHKDAFLFKNTIRSNSSPSGLDYQKTIIIKNMDYIDSKNTAVVDNDEYIKMKTNIEKIVEKVNKYITKYVKHINGTKVLHEKEFQRHYQYSTLKYFHDILGI